MDQEKIDRLFREKMDSLEVTPSAEAWSQVEKQIRPKSAFKLYWLAAAAVLIFASWALWPTQTGTIEGTPIASDVIYPPLNEAMAFDMLDKIEIKKEESSKQAIKKAPVLKPILVAKEVTTNEAKETAVLEEMPLELETKNISVVAKIDEPEIIDELINEQPVSFTPVKIIYIASASDQRTELQKADSSNTFKKIMAFAEKIDPGDVLADFKSAKDNLLNNGFKKRDKSTL